MSSIEVGQVYRSTDPRNPSARLRVMGIYVNRADVFYLHTGRGGSILLASLHASSITKAGRPRRTGYVLEVSR